MPQNMFYAMPTASQGTTPIYTGPVYQQPMATPTPNTSIAWVRGEAEAYSFPVAAGMSVLLMDRDSLTMYSKSVDMSGRLSMDVYDLVRRESKSNDKDPSAQSLNDYVTKDELGKIVSDAVDKALHKKGMHKPYNNKTQVKEGRDE